MANQLWNYMSIYAFALNRGAELRNPSFFEYHYLFNIIQKEGLVTRIYSTFFKTPRRRSHIINRIGRLKYSIFSKIILAFHSSCVISSKNTSGGVIYLPPTTKMIESFDSCKTLYFTGWLFRNPEGLKKYRKEILSYFQPTKNVVDKVDSFITDIKKKYSAIVGVHIRHGDYKNFKQGLYWIDQRRIRQIIDEYLSVSGKDPKYTCFVITSDGPIDELPFNGLNIKISRMNAVEDLFLLAQTNIILGSDSSFGDFASWYGDVPHVIFKNEPIDWDYYAGKDKYFANKYSQLSQ